MIIWWTDSAKAIFVENIDTSRKGNPIQTGRFGVFVQWIANVDVDAVPNSIGSTPVTSPVPPHQAPAISATADIE